MRDVATDELVELCAIDDELYCRTFFPRTFRQDFPHFHDELTQTLEDPAHRYVALKMFRGSAKTTRLRAFVTKRIAYAMSNTIMFVSNAQKHSGFSLKWVRRQVDYNTLWARTFGLERGSTWNDEQIEIIHSVDRRVINVLAFGITGQIRGINLDDWRPDLIVIDDPDNEETTNTPEQREKTSDLVFGALQKSLSPPTENPTAKMVLLQTPFNSFDLISTCEKSPAWHVQTVGCFDNQGTSVWEARYPTEFLQSEKAEHGRLNKMSLWMREMECRIVAPETASFDVTWLKYWDASGGLPPNLVKYIAIDPASSDSKNADDQVCGVVGFRGQDTYLIDYTAEKGEMPEAVATTFIGYLISHVIHRAAIEAIAYQRVLAWYIEQKMRTMRKWVIIDQVQDKRKKSDRIIQALRDKAANGHLYVHSKHTKFVQQFAEYRPGVEMQDDVLDMVSMAITSHKGYGNVYDEDSVPVIDESDIPELERVVEGMAP
jgi:hypothetical protein